MNVLSAIEFLKSKHSADTTAATLEEVAAACGIDVNAPFSYREILDMVDELRRSVYVCQFWLNGERRYFATGYQGPKVTP